MLTSLQNASLPLPFTWGVIRTTLRAVSLREWFRAHARVDGGEREQKRDVPVVNGRKLERRQEERPREAVFARVKEKWLEGPYLSGRW